jgi:hypothetical protein
VIAMDVIEWQEFVESFQQLKSKGMIESVGQGPSSIKSTFLSQIMAASVFHPEYGELAIHCKRAGSGTALSGFSKEPTYRDGWGSKDLLLSYGIPGKYNHLHCLFTNLYSTSESSHGLRIHADSNNFLSLCNSSGEKLAMWSSKGVRKGFDKHRAFLVVITKEEKSESTHFFHFNELHLFVGNTDFSNMENVSKLIDSRHLSLELRMFLTEDHEHCSQKGMEPGRVRNHGTAWRYGKKALTDLFEQQRIV